MGEQPVTGGASAKPASRTPSRADQQTHAEEHRGDGQDQPGLCGRGSGEQLFGEQPAERARQ